MVASPLAATVVTAIWRCDFCAAKAPPSDSYPWATDLMERRGCLLLGVPGICQFSESLPSGVLIFGILGFEISEDCSRTSTRKFCPKKSHEKTTKKPRSSKQIQIQRNTIFELFPLWIRTNGNLTWLPWRPHPQNISKKLRILKKFGG